MKTKILSERLTKIEDKIIVAGFFSDVRPLKGLAGEIDWLFNGQISKLILDGKLTGQTDDSLLLYSNRLRTRNILLLGMGRREKFDSSAVKNTAKLLVNKLSAMNIKNFTTEIFGSGYSSLEGSNVFKLMLSEFKKFDDMDVNFYVGEKEADSSLGIKLKETHGLEEGL